MEESVHLVWTSKDKTGNECHNFLLGIFKGTITDILAYINNNWYTEGYTLTIDDVSFDTKILIQVGEN